LLLHFYFSIEHAQLPSRAAAPSCPRRGENGRFAYIFLATSLVACTGTGTGLSPLSPLLLNSSVLDDDDVSPLVTSCSVGSLVRSSFSAASPIRRRGLNSAKVYRFSSPSGTLASSYFSSSSFFLFCLFALSPLDHPFFLFFPREEPRQSSRPISFPSPFLEKSAPESKRRTDIPAPFHFPFPAQRAFCYSHSVRFPLFSFECSEAHDFSPPEELRGVPIHPLKLEVLLLLLSRVASTSFFPRSLPPHPPPPPSMTSTSQGSQQGAAFLPRLLSTVPPLFFSRTRNYLLLLFPLSQIVRPTFLRVTNDRQLSEQHPLFLSHVPISFVAA